MQFKEWGGFKSENIYFELYIHMGGGTHTQEVEAGGSQGLRPAWDTQHTLYQKQKKGGWKRKKKIYIVTVSKQNKVK